MCDFHFHHKRFEYQETKVRCLPLYPRPPNPVDDEHDQPNLRCPGWSRGLARYRKLARMWCVRVGGSLASLARPLPEPSVDSAPLGSSRVRADEPVLSQREGV